MSYSEASKVIALRVPTDLADLYHDVTLKQGVPLSSPIKKFLWDYVDGEKNLAPARKAKKIKTKEMSDLGINKLD